MPRKRPKPKRMKSFIQYVAVDNEGKPFGYVGFKKDAKDDVRWLGRRGRVAKVKVIEVAND